MKTIYSAGIASRAQEPQLARDFVDRFRKAQALLIDAGYELAS
jgi:hypothetical protein